MNDEDVGPYDTVPVHIEDVDRIAESLDGVRRTKREELVHWRYHGRLIARQLDDRRIVIRAEFDHRRSLLAQFPNTFSVPEQFRRHMMVVADLATADRAGIEDAIEAAWVLQCSAG